MTDKNEEYQEPSLSDLTPPRFNTRDEIKNELASLIKYSVSTKKKLSSFLSEVKKMHDTSYELVDQINFYLNFTGRCISEFEQIEHEINYQVFDEHIKMLKEIYLEGEKYYNGYYREGYGFNEYFGLVKADTIDSLNQITRGFVYDIMIEANAVYNGLKGLADRKNQISFYESNQGNIAKKEISPDMQMGTDSILDSNSSYDKLWTVINNSPGLDDIISVLKIWGEKTNLAFKDISKIKFDAKQNEIVFDDPAGVSNYIDTTLIICRNFTKEFARLVKELKGPIHEGHQESLRQIQENSKLHERESVSFKREHINRDMSDESARPFLDRIYAESRMAMRFLWDTGTIADRLKVFITQQQDNNTKTIINGESEKDRDFGNKINDSEITKIPFDVCSEKRLNEFLIRIYPELNQLYQGMLKRFKHTTGKKLVDAIEIELKTASLEFYENNRHLFNFLKKSYISSTYVYEYRVKQKKAIIGKQLKIAVDNSLPEISVARTIKTDANSLYDLAKGICSQTA